MTSGSVPVGNAGNGSLTGNALTGLNALFCTTPATQAGLARGDPGGKGELPLPGDRQQDGRAGGHQALGLEEPVTAGDPRDLPLLPKTKPSRSAAQKEKQKFAGTFKKIRHAGSAIVANIAT